MLDILNRGELFWFRVLSKGLNIPYVWRSISRAANSAIGFTGDKLCMFLRVRVRRNCHFAQSALRDHTINKLLKAYAT